MVEISKDEYALEVLKDEFAKGNLPQKIAPLIENPDLQSEAENTARLLLMGVNGGIGHQLSFRSFNRFCQEQVDMNAFLQLEWCPKGPNVIGSDELERYTGGSRKFDAILKKLCEEGLPSGNLRDFFVGEIPTVESGHRRIFIFTEPNGKKYCQDGNHRAGRILAALSQKLNADVFPLEVFMAECN